MNLLIYSALITFPSRLIIMHEGVSANVAETFLVADGG